MSMILAMTNVATTGEHDGERRPPRTGSTTCCGLPSMRPGRIDGRGREHARGDGAEHAAHAMDREHVERVVDLERALSSVAL